MAEESNPGDERTEGAAGGAEPQTPKIIDGVKAAKPATEEHLKKVEGEMNAFERSTLHWTQATFGILLVTCLFISLQWCEMRSGSSDTHALAVAAGKQADRTKDLADRMKDQADQTKIIADQSGVQAGTSKRLAQNAVETLRNTQKSFRDEQRAWVGVQDARSNDFGETTPWKVSVIFFNSGRTAARNVQSSGMYKTSNIAISGPPLNDIKRLTSRPVQSIAPQGRYIQILGASPPAEPVSSFQIQGGKELIAEYQLIKNGRSSCTISGY